MPESKVEQKFHWVENIADRILKEKKSPYVITSGITPSGPVHLGTVSEFIFPSAVAKFLKSKGKKVKFIFHADTLDAFDSIPLTLEKFADKLLGNLGKPLCNVMDPYSCHKSLADHYVSETVEVMKRLKTDPMPEILKVNEMYAKGLFDEYALLFLKNYFKARDIFFKTSLKEDKGEPWNPIMPICENCGKIATTEVTDFDADGGWVHYKCVKNVGYTKGCNHEATMKIKDHKYKIAWRLHWPSWMDIANSSAEGAGVDHHSRGSSWDTCVVVFKELFFKKPPVGWMHGLILYHGKKVAKSKGIGFDLEELLNLVPPELLKYFLFRQDIWENKDVDPTGQQLINLFDDYKRIAELAEKGEETELHRAERKKLVAYMLSGERKWKADFSEILINYQLYKNWEETGKALNDPNGVMYLSKYIESWFKMGFAPENLVFEFKPKKILENKEAVIAFAKKLSEKMKAVDIHNLVYEVAKEKNLRSEKLFKTLYKLLIGKEIGPRFGKLVEAVGPGKVKEVILKLYR